MHKEMKPELTILDQDVPDKEVAVKKVSSNQKNESQKIAVILVRGLVKMRRPIKDTLVMLKLTRKNHCVVVENSPLMLGMVKKVKDYVTWGEISDNVFKELVEKRGKLYLGRLSDSKGKYNYNVLDYNGKKYKTYFSLNPPRKGFGRKGIKLPFSVSGALGYRREKINDLILRML